MNMLNLLKKISNRLNFIFYTHSSRYKLRYLYSYDRKRFIRHAGSLHHEEKEQKLASVIMAYHVVEKGLSMPERRLGFGHDAVLELISLIRDYSEKFPQNDQILHAISVLDAYREMHRKENFSLRPDLQQALDSLLADFPPAAKEDGQIEITRELYYAHLESSFPEFSASRHSVRHFNGPVSLEQIERAVSLARNAPSACNRQHTRVHCICDKETRKKVLSLQNGNRGFGHLADKLLIITADLHDIRWEEERNDLYTNAGIFLMNLCYALHANKVAHCLLNWSVSPFRDILLRKLVSIPDHETVICILACGDCPEQFSLASSPRKPVSEILTVHR